MGRGRAGSDGEGSDRGDSDAPPGRVGQDECRAPEASQAVVSYSTRGVRQGVIGLVVGK